MQSLGLRPTIVPPPREIFLLAGASNMSGRGLLSEVPAFVNAGRVKVYSNAGAWMPGAEPTDDATGQVDAVSSDSGVAAASPGMSFGTSLAALRFGKQIGLVPCAKGSSTMDDWAQNASRSTLYGSMIARATEAAATGTIKGVLFYGGGNDTTSLASVNAFPSKFYAWMADVRADLGLPDLPFISTVLGPYSADPNGWEQAMRDKQAAMAAPGLAVVSAADLTGKVGDIAHLDTVSIVIIGRRYATAMAGMLD